MNKNRCKYFLFQYKTSQQHPSNRNRNQFAIFKPLSYCFKETIAFDVKASFASRPLSRLIRWYNHNRPDDITKEFWEKDSQFHGNFHGLKITNWNKQVFLENIEFLNHPLKNWKLHHPNSKCSWRNCKLLWKTEKCTTQIINVPGEIANCCGLLETVWFIITHAEKGWYFIRIFSPGIQTVI